MNYVNNIGAICSLFLTLVAVITLLSKTVRSFWKKIFNSSSQELREENSRQTKAIELLSNKMDTVLIRVDQLSTRIDAIEGVSRQQCRDTIKEIYYKYSKEKKIPLYERKTADRTWEAYKKFPHANTYAQLLYQEICKWEIDDITHKDLIQED